MKGRSCSNLFGVLLVVGLLLAPAAPTVFAAGLATQDLAQVGATPEDLVASLLGPGVTFSNVTFQGVNWSAGYFSGGDGILGDGFDSGVILSTGNIATVVGPNDEAGASTANGLPGDADLNTLIVGYQTFDATWLAFDFVPTSNVIVFDYVFGSEEYNEYVFSQFNNVFGFFLNGVNVALVPGTTTAVAINNVNNGNYGGSGSPKWESCTNCAYYRNNAAPEPATINTELDGLTTVLQVVANVNPGVVNHIKLAVSDAGDNILDSDVFIKAGSFTAPALTLGPLNAENTTGFPHTLTATATAGGMPQAGITVNFEVIAGPNTGMTGSGVTNDLGEATWSYTSSLPGMDEIEATTTILGEAQTSNLAYKTWVQPPNSPPTADAGGDYTGAEGASVALAGTADDPDGDALIYAWTYAPVSGVDAGATCAFDFDAVLNPAVTCTDDGIFEVTLTVNDGVNPGVIDTAAVTLANAAPVITGITPAGGVTLGSETTVSANFTDAGTNDTHTCAINWGDGVTTDGTVAAGTCSGAHTYAAPACGNTIIVTVTDDDGGSATVSTSAGAHYTFTGFFPPVDNPPVINTVKAGSAIPVKFSLGGDFGMNIFAAGYPISRPINCQTGAPADPIEETVTAGNSSLNYDPVTMQYNYVWKTVKSWRGCRELVVRLNDCTERTALFSFK